MPLPEKEYRDVLNMSDKDHEDMALMSPKERKEQMRKYVLLVRLFIAFQPYHRKHYDFSIEQLQQVLDILFSKEYYNKGKV